MRPLSLVSAFTLACSFSAVAALAGCSGAESTADPAGAQPAIISAHTEFCPRSLAETNGTLCDEGAACLLRASCRDMEQAVTCRCEGGRFHCADQAGELPVGSAPRCVAMGAEADEHDQPVDCPRSQFAGTGNACGTLGKSCFYEGEVCPKGSLRPQMLDWCECSGGRDGNHRYICYRLPCNPYDVTTSAADDGERRPRAQTPIVIERSEPSGP
jgi:hypothetical protein